MALTNKEIELVYLGSSIAAGCKPCTSYHYNKANEAGAAKEEIKNTIERSIYIRDISRMEIEDYALNLFWLYKQSDVNRDNMNQGKIEIAVSIGAAFAVNCFSTLNSNIELGKSVGLSNDDLNKIFRTAKFVKMKAASYVDKISLGFINEKSDEKNYETNECCC